MADNESTYPDLLLTTSGFFYWAGVVDVLLTGMSTLAFAWAVNINDAEFPDWGHTYFFYLLIVFAIAATGLWFCGLAKAFFRAPKVPPARTGLALLALIFLSLPAAIYFHFKR